MKADAANKTTAKRIRVRSGLLKEFTEEAKIKFELTSDFNVSLETIISRIKSGNLKVFRPGPGKNHFRVLLDLSMTIG